MRFFIIFPLCSLTLVVDTLSHLALSLPFVSKMIKEPCCFLRLWPRCLHSTVTASWQNSPDKQRRLYLTLLTDQAVGAALHLCGISQTEAAAGNHIFGSSLQAASTSVRRQTCPERFLWSLKINNEMTPRTLRTCCSCD